MFDGVSIGDKSLDNPLSVFGLRPEVVEERRVKQRLAAAAMLICVGKGEATDRASNSPRLAPMLGDGALSAFSSVPIGARKANLRRPAPAYEIANLTILSVDMRHADKRDGIATKLFRQPRDLTEAKPMIERCEPYVSKTEPSGEKGPSYAVEPRVS